MKNKGFMTSVQLHIPSSVEFSFPFCWCGQIPGFRWERQAVRDESKCHFCRDQCENQTHCWCFGLFHVLYCLLLPSSHSSASRKLKKKSADKQLVRESSVYFLLIQEEETKIRSLRQHHAPSWTPSLPLSATTRVREPSGPVIPEPRTDLAGRFTATSCLQTLFPTPFFLLHCWTAFIFLSCKNLQSLF